MQIFFVLPSSFQETKGSLWDKQASHLPAKLKRVNYTGSAQAKFESSSRKGKLDFKSF